MTRNNPLLLKVLQLNLENRKGPYRLSIDKLKAKCEERKLSTDGTKNQLADKIIVHDNTVEIADINDD